MVKVEVNLDREENRIVGFFKVNYDLSSKEAAIKLIIRRCKL